MAGLLEGKCGLITGGGSGMGRAIAQLFTSEGAKVLIAGRTVAKLEETRKLVREAGGVCEIMKVDVSVEEQVKAMVDRTVELFGTLDFACNNASIETTNQPIWERDTDSVREVMEADFYSVFYGIKYESAVMVKQGHGSIVNTTSGAGTVGVTNMDPYAAAKAAANNLTLSSAMGLGAHGVRVNAILPGLTLTPMVQQLKEHHPAFAAEMEAAIPMERMNTPEEQANAALFLASDMSSGVTGELLRVDGGYLAGYYNSQKK
ncbi:MAG TPA: SDR family oxidoreductase [Candidatus Pelethocola excrementipullorum]|nr:SDR family oxidoreductase [Candidatus Pelethocola excrementipullorum]